MIITQLCGDVVMLFHGLIMTNDGYIPNDGDDGSVDDSDDERDNDGDNNSGNDGGGGGR